MQIYDTFFIGGEFVKPETDAVIDVVSPHTEQVIGQVPDASPADIGPAAIPVLTRHLRDPAENVRAVAVAALGHLHALDAVPEMHSVLALFEGVATGAGTRAAQGPHPGFSLPWRARASRTAPGPHRPPDCRS